MAGLTYRHVLARLATGPIDSGDEEYWTVLRFERERVQKHFAEMGLQLIVQENDGFAYLRQIPEDEEESPALPRILRRRRLSLEQTLLMLFLRERLLIHQSTPDAEQHLFLKELDLVNLMRPLYPEKSNERPLYDRVRALITQFVSWKLLRPFQMEGVQAWRVEPILKARVPAEEIKVLRDRLQSMLEGEPHKEDSPHSDHDSAEGSEEEEDSDHKA